MRIDETYLYRPVSDKIQNWLTINGKWFYRNSLTRQLSCYRGLPATRVFSRDGEMRRHGYGSSTFDLTYTMVVLRAAPGISNKRGRCTTLSQSRFPLSSKSTIVHLSAVFKSFHKKGQCRRQNRVYGWNRRHPYQRNVGQERREWRVLTERNVSAFVRRAQMSRSSRQNLLA